MYARRRRNSLSDLQRRGRILKRAKKNPDVTPNGIIVHALRLLWLHSRERRAALKRDRYTCQDCNRKQTMAKGREFKVQVDHLNGIEWTQMVEYIRRHLLVPHDQLETVCKEDHEKRTALRKQIEGGLNVTLRLEGLGSVDSDRTESDCPDGGIGRGVGRGSDSSEEALTPPGGWDDVHQ